MECTEMHCSAVDRDHEYGDDGCDWTLTVEQKRTREWGDKVAEIRGYLGRGPAGGLAHGVPPDDLLVRFATLANEWSDIARLLTERFGTTLEDGADWQDFESDVAMKDFLFWWTWGN